MDMRYTTKPADSQSNQQINRPWLTIITVNYNDRGGLLRTLESIKSQTLRSFEHIVVDGGSTDGSQEVLTSGQFILDRWVSESDGGVYHAMNKGLSMAGGEHVIFMNSGDHFLSDDSLEVATAGFDDVDIHYFGVEVIEPMSDGGSKVYVKQYPEDLRFSFFIRDSLCHQATIIRRRIFERLGPYDESMKVCADWRHFLLAICRDNCSYQRHQQVLSTFYADGLSSKPGNQQLLMDERWAVIENEFPRFARDARFLRHAEQDHESVKALRSSKIIRVLQQFNLLWKF